MKRNKWNKRHHQHHTSRSDTFPVLTNVQAVLTVWALLIAGGPAFLSGQVQWDTNGKFLVYAGTSSIHASAAVDDSGGFFFAYEDNQTGDNDIRCHWVDGSGIKRWGESGVLVSGSGGDQQYPAIVPDQAGGAWVAWQDVLSTNLYLQHIGADGIATGPSGGTTVCSATGEQSRIRAVSDQNGGLILVWMDKRSGSTSDLYAQRFDASGNALWTSNGIPVTTATGNQSAHAVTSDGSGGVFVVWQDARNGYSNIDVYAQRVSSSGTALWTANGIAVTTAASNQYSPTADTSAGNFIVGWDDARYDNGDVFAQALDLSGNVLWTADGIPVSQSDGTQVNSRITRDGSGGALLVWSDYRTDYNIYAQKVNGSGQTLWTPGGISVASYEGYQYSPEIVQDGCGGAFVVFTDNRTMSDINQTALHIDSQGEVSEPSDGFAVAWETGTQQNPVLLSDGSGGMTVIWQDGRNSVSDIYSQHINDNIQMILPATDTILAGNASQTISWAFRTPATKFHHLDLRLSLEPGDGYPVSVAESLAPVQTVASWLPEPNSSSSARIGLFARDRRDSLIAFYEGEIFVVDSDPPVPFNLVTPADGTIVLNQPSFTWTSTEDAISGFDHFELWINESMVQDNLTNVSYTLTSGQVLTPGFYDWTVKAVDRAGLIREASETRTIHVVSDTTPPSPFHLLTPVPASWTNQTQPFFSWEAAADEGTGISKYQLECDGVVVLDNLPSGTTSVQSIVLDPGTHAWRIRAFNGVGLSRWSEEIGTFTIDSEGPEAFSLLNPPDDAWTADTTPGFSWQATSDSDGGIGLAGYKLYIDGSLKRDSIPGDSTSIPCPVAGLSGGDHTWKVEAFDSLGNATLSNVFSVRVDTTAPDDFALLSPSDDETLTDLLPRFAWAASEDAGSGLEEYELWIDGILNYDALTDLSTPPSGILAEGSHSWQVLARDKVGNVRSSETFQFLADTTRPEPFNLVQPASHDTIRTELPVFVWRSTDDLVSGFDRFELYIDGILRKGNLGRQDTTWTADQTMENGTYHWKVLAHDKAGNIRIPESVIFHVKKRPPVITSAGQVQALEDEPFRYIPLAVDPDGDPVVLSVSGLASWMTLAGNTVEGTPVEGTPDTSFLVKASDGKYSDSLQVMVEFLGVNDPPHLTSADTAIAVEDVLFDYQATATDIENDSLTFSFDIRPSWLSPSGARLSGFPVDGTADTTFRVIVSDGDRSDTMVVRLAVTPVNDAPRITSPDSVEAFTGASFSYQASAEDPDGPILSFKYFDLPDWLVSQAGALEGTAPYGSQDTSFTLIASDGSLSDTLLVHVAVVRVNRPPRFDYPLPSLVFAAGDTLDLTIDLDDYVSDPEDPDSVLFLACEPVGVTPIVMFLDSTTHTATLRAAVGDDDFGFVFTISDPAGASKTDTLRVTIDRTAVDPWSGTSLPSEFVLSPNFPNPFNPATTVRYGLPHACRVTVEIFNTAGQRVATLIDADQSAGYHEVRWEASDHASGVYILRMKTPHTTAFGRMLLLK